MNFDLKMQEQLKEIPEGEKLLLHACCAPCTSGCLEHIADHFQIDIFFYNPNITEEKEYEKRLNELKRFIPEFKTKYPIQVIDGEYDAKKFFEISKGLENEPERGKRCYKCYELRIEETARMAEKLGYRYFTTTLSLSPHKNVEWVNEIGERFGQNYDTNFLYCDFKKREGYKRSIELSKIYNLYRQDYCGCIYSKKEAMDRRNKQN
ncbi:MAG: epoxyqueuosine reductase QueH [Bacilli bacterium]|nr:epoxyqueuosine reductase QueH [Bacilli bacterium]